VLDRVKARVAAAVAERNQLAIDAQEQRGRQLDELEALEANLAELEERTREERATDFGEQKLADLGELSVREFSRRLTEWDNRNGPAAVTEAEEALSQERLQLQRQESELKVTLLRGLSKRAIDAAQAVQHTVRRLEKELEPRELALVNRGRELAGLEKELVAIRDNRVIPARHRAAPAHHAMSAVDRLRDAFRLVKQEAAKLQSTIDREEAAIAKVREEISGLKDELEWFDNTAWRDTDVFEPGDLVEGLDVED
jgi:hypothetical protein